MVGVMACNHFVEETSGKKQELCYNNALPSSPLLAYLVIRRRVLCQPAFLYLCDVPDESLLPRLHDFMKDDPVRLSILSMLSALSYQD